MGFGERLQREREMRSITLEEIAHATKIGTRALRALEEGDFDKLPGGIFNKGFVRAYARYLGIDEEQAVADYMAASGEPEETDTLDPEHLKKLEANWKPPKRESLYADHLPIPWGALLVLVLLGAALAAWYFRNTITSAYQQWHRGHSPATERTTAQQSTPGNYEVPPVPATPPPAPPEAARPAPSAAPATSSAAGKAAAKRSPEVARRSKPAEARSSAAPAKDEFIVRVHALEDSWVLITADGKPIMIGVLNATRATSVRAKQRITVMAGNAGGIELSFNGKPQPALGANNEVRTVTFTPEGMQQ